MKKGKLITIGGAIVVLALCGYFKRENQFSD